MLHAHDDIAAVIIEPTGASWGQVPIAQEFVEALAELTKARGVLLIFDEVISGFRCSPGGAQAYYRIRPDMTTLAKILAGGLPGGALAGRRDILELLDFSKAAQAGAKRSRTTARSTAAHSRPPRASRPSRSSPRAMRAFGPTNSLPDCARR